MALTRARIEDQIRRFTLAASDMSQSGAAALRLQITEEINLARALETAIVVFYARPFGNNNGIGSVDRKTYAPRDPAQREIHYELLSLRKLAYAHTDEEGSGRGITDTARRGQAREAYYEYWLALDCDALPAVIALCEAQFDLGLDRPAKPLGCGDGGSVV